MKNKNKINNKILTLLALVVFSMPIAVSAQGFWDVFTAGYWYSVVANGIENPGDDKKKDPKPVNPPSGPSVPDLPAGEYCRNEIGELVPCQID